MITFCTYDRSCRIFRPFGRHIVILIHAHFRFHIGFHFMQWFATGGRAGGAAYYIIIIIIHCTCESTNTLV